MDYLDKKITHIFKAHRSKEVLDHLQDNPSQYKNLVMNALNHQIEISIIGSDKEFVIILRDSLMIWNKMIEEVENVLRSVNRTNIINQVIQDLG